MLTIVLSHYQPVSLTEFSSHGSLAVKEGEGDGDGEVMLHEGVATELLASLLCPLVKVQHIE